ncbi:MAG: hypothetical protein BWY22_01281 [Bacteroidetes bacterium ADurb.Bin217]|nr:MAG: hypothetical protein BWY22_01281 [Bacteroidetes bacterium ADurb.Bin217]
MTIQSQTIDLFYTMYKFALHTSLIAISKQFNYLK